jgi:hypothetical protein
VVEHYHTARHHQGRDKVIPMALPPRAAGSIRRRQRLGGVLSYYDRRAA